MMSIAQSIQADQEPRRFRGLRETLARERREPAPSDKAGKPTEKAE